MVRIALRSLTGAILLAAGALALSTCSNALLDEMSRLANEADRPGINPASGSTITAHEIITLTFKQSMDPGSVSISGSIGSGGSLKWQTSSASNDTLVLNYYAAAAPIAAWNPGASRQLVVTVSSGSKSTFTYSYDVFRGACVRTSGADGNTGTALSPRLTVGGGISAVQSPTLYNGTGEVHLAEGTYQVNPLSGGEPTIVMQSGISVYGGYAADWSVRDPVSHPSTVRDMTTAVAASYDAPTAAITCGPSLPRSTILDGLAIYGTSNAVTATYSAAVYCDGSPTIRNCSLFAGSSTNSSTQQYALMLSQSSGTPNPLVSGNTINTRTVGGSTAASVCVGVYVINPVNAEITGNSISAGRGGYTYGIRADDGLPTILLSGNTIDGGTGTTDSTCVRMTGPQATPATIQNNILVGGNSGGSGSSYLVYTDSSLKVRNNILNLYWDTSQPDVNLTYGFYITAPVSPQIDNNVFIVSKTYSLCGVYEAAAAAPSSCRNNDFSNFALAGQYMYHDSAGGNWNTLPSVNAAGNNASGNIADAPNLDSSYRFTASSPFTVTAGGLNLTSSWSGAADRTGKARPATGAWSIGCYENN